jgi:pyruvate ferredoxin oxidoreductase alpha subunit
MKQKEYLESKKAHADAGHITTDIQQFSGLRGPHLGYFQTKRG